MTKKRWIILASVLLGLLIVGLAGVFFIRRNSTAVKVFNFNEIGMTEYWGDSKESYGPVSTDKVQTVYLSQTQEVTEILVAQGDTVQKGDLLLRFDTTLSDLALERKRLDVEKVRLQLASAESELVRIKNLKPLVPRPPIDETEDLGVRRITVDFFRVEYAQDGEECSLYDGSSRATPMVIWVPDGTVLDEATLNEIRAECRELRLQAAIWEELQDEPDSSFSVPDIPPVDGFFAVIKMTQGDYEKGSNVVFQGVYISGSSIRYLYDVYSENSGFIDPLAIFDAPSFEEDDSSGYTYAEIQKMRQAKEKEIKDLQIKVKNAEADYKLAQIEAGDGNVYAQTDGRITSLISEEEAKERNAPLLKLSGGGGFYIKGTVNELDRELLTIGQSVNVQDWQNGGFYEGNVVSVGEFPTDEGANYGDGNPNASFYPFMVFVDESADLAAGSYVSVQYSLEGASRGLYLEMPFVRTEGGSSYVYVRGENDRLEKRTVTTGKQLWGSYIQITSGLSAQDKLAFPYGKTVRPGAKCEPGQLRDLYGY